MTSPLTGAVCAAFRAQSTQNPEKQHCQRHLGLPGLPDLSVVPWWSGFVTVGSLKPPKKATDELRSEWVMERIGGMAWRELQGCTLGEPSCWIVDANCQTLLWSRWTRLKITPSASIPTRTTNAPLCFHFHFSYMLHHGAGYTRLHLSDGVLEGWETKYSTRIQFDCALQFVSSRLFFLA